MCLAVPMKIVRLLDHGRALVRQDELETEIDISLLEDPQLGDYVIVHAGFALEALDLEEAEARLELFRQMAGPDSTP